MLSKCANPECSAHFLYLRQGKLFRFEVESARVGLAASKVGKILVHTEYFWLCDECVRTMTVVHRGACGVSVIPLLTLKAAS